MLTGYKAHSASIVGIILSFFLNRRSVAAIENAVRLCTFAFTISALTAAISTHAAADVPVNWPPATFQIAAWCTPPEPFITKDQYRKYANAGFTLLMPPCDGKATRALNNKILETARQTGLKAIIADERMPLAIGGKPEALAAIKAIVNDYRKAPALMGYFLTDEPGAASFAGLAEVVAEFKKLDPDHIVYVNLFPNYASTSLNAKQSQLQTDTYDKYLDVFMKTVHPDVLSWDHYNLTKTGDRAGFFGNLYSAQQAANVPDNVKPFWQIVLSVEHGPYRKLSEDELRFEAMQSLVFGVSGLVYFTYWLPNDSSFTWQNSIANRDGTPGALYEGVKNVNKEVATLQKYLYNSLWVETFQTGRVPPDGRGPVADDTIRVTGGADLTVGVFRGAGGYLYTMITNRSYTTSATAAMSINLGKRPVEVLDIRTNKWSVVASRLDSDENTNFAVDLKSAGAALIRWK